MSSRGGKDDHCIGREALVLAVGEFLSEAPIMWRSFFLAIGITLIILGVECLGIESVNLKMRDKPPAPTSPWDTAPKVGPNKKLTPQNWAPWSLMSSGIVVCLYSFTIPRRVQGT